MFSQLVKLLSYLAELLNQIIELLINQILAEIIVVEYF